MHGLPAPAELAVVVTVVLTVVPVVGAVSPVWLVPVPDVSPVLAVPVCVGPLSGPVLGSTGATMMLRGAAPAASVAMISIVLSWAAFDAGVTRATALVPGSVNHTWASGPASTAIPNGFAPAVTLCSCQVLVPGT